MTMQIRGLHIDDRVASLVAALNEMPGITTSSSCGGHRNSTVGQVEFGHFDVDFYLAQSKKGWASLTFLVTVCQDLYLEVDTDIQPWVDGMLRWDLRGRGDPNILAARLKEGPTQ